MSAGDLVRFHLDSNHTFIGIVLEVHGIFDAVVLSSRLVCFWPVDNCEVISESR